MGAMEDVHKHLTEAGEKAADVITDGAEKLHDKANEMRADARVEAAKADRDQVKRDIAEH